MPEICRFYGIVIRMYFQDHNPPHFHAEYQGARAEYEIRTLERLAGELPKRANAMVLEWSAQHKEDCYPIERKQLFPPKWIKLNH
ncbi:MAG TPA: DUF4160 domain-containing protein [Salinimicrobium sp.]|nr:DUF4160 domain-containing protein [Salinimicrobium sp.]